MLNSLSAFIDFIKELSILGIFISILYVKYGLKFFFFSSASETHPLTTCQNSRSGIPGRLVRSGNARLQGSMEQIGCGSWPQIYLGLNPGARWLG